MAWAPKVGDHLLVSCDAFKNKGSTVVKIMGPADDMTILVSWDDESEHMNQWIEFDPNLIKAGPDTALALCAHRRSAAPPPRRPAAPLTIVRRAALTGGWGGPRTPSSRMWPHAAP